MAVSMVAEKDVVSLESSSSSALSIGGCPNFLDQQSLPLYLGVPPSINSNVVDENDDSLQDLCEVVLSLRCKKCSFLCHDKTTLHTHVRENHKSNHGKVNETVDLNTAAANNETDVVDNLSSNVSTCGTNKSCVVESTDGIGKYQPKVLTVEETSTETLEEVEDIFLCAACDIVFASEELCCNHMSQAHNLNRFSTKCIRDEILSKSPEKDKPQRRRVRPPKQYTAEGGAIVPKKYRVTKDVLHSCSKCPAKFESIEVNKFHEQCHIKEMKFRSGSTTNSSTKGFSCPVCETKNTVSASVIFPTWGKCSLHLYKEHKIDCELYSCSICTDFKSNLITKVKEHELLHSASKSFKCTTCHKTFKQSKQLRTHEKYHKEKMTKLPPPSDSRWYTPKQCPVCSRILSDSKCLKKHISAVHNKLKPYVCNICGHTSARKAELLLHVRQHTGEKPYKCLLCPFVTGDHNSLRKHKLRHGDQRPYACPHCDYRCIQSCSFKKHIMSYHPGQKIVFQCQLCSHVSVNESVSAAHQKDHEEGRLPVAESSNESDSNSNTQTSATSNVTSGVTASLLTNSNEETRRVAEKRTKYWLGEDDSIDMVDTGGITIPAPTMETENNPTLKLSTESNNNSNDMEDSNSDTPSSYSDSENHTTASMTDALSETSTVEFFQTHESNRQSTKTSIGSEEPESPPSDSDMDANAPGSVFHDQSNALDMSKENINKTVSPLVGSEIQLTPMDLSDIMCSDNSNSDTTLERLLGYKIGSFN